MKGLIDLKKTYILLCVLIIVLLVGCSNNKVKIIENSNDLNKIKSEISLIPKEYNADTAVKDGCFVIVHGELKSETNIMDNFVLDSKNRKSSAITIVQYTEEGDPIITKVVYNGHSYYGVEDDTRDAFSSLENRKYWEFEYKYLKVFEENDSKRYYLVNDEKLTSEDIWKSVISSQSSDMIVHKYLCSYDD